jgi:hypothetical protein
MKPTVFFLSLGLLLSACHNQPNLQTEQTLLQKGEYLVTVAGCNDCHSPKIITNLGPVPDPARLLSGHPANEMPATYDSISSKGWILFSFSGTSAHGPWGTSFAANITPDSTGIGSWTSNQFLNAMQNGYYHGIEGTRKLLPPMPWQTYAKMKKEDILAIFEYLKSIKPVKNIIPAAIPPAN